MVIWPSVRGADHVDPVRARHLAVGVVEDLDRAQDVQRLGAVDGEDQDAADRWHADNPATSERWRLGRISH